MSEFNLTPGSRYRVTSFLTREETTVTEATFEGITSMGSVDAMVLENEEGTQLVPTHVVVKVDVLEDAEAEGFDAEDDTMYT